MRTRLGSTVAALALLLCVVAVVVCVRSYFVRDVMSAGSREAGVVGLSTSRGMLLVCRTPPQDAGGRAPRFPGLCHFTARPVTWESAAPMNYWTHPFRVARAVKGVDPPPATWETHWSFAGLAYQTGWNLVQEEGRWRRATVNARLLLLPLWPIALVTAIPPTLWLRGRSRQRRVAWRRRNQQCVACGYDLRGGGGTCPECGQQTMASGN